MATHEAVFPVPGEPTTSSSARELALTWSTTAD